MSKLIILLVLPLLASLSSCAKADMIEYGVRYRSTYFSSNESGVGIVNMVADTTVSTSWNGSGKILRSNGYLILGAGTVTNFIIDAALTVPIFDTAITLTNISTYTNVFSCAWYGAKYSNGDNWWNIQKSINTCLTNGIRNCFLPTGTYNHSKTIEIIKTTNNAYAFCTLHFFGDAEAWGVSAGTTLLNTSASESGFNLQLNKGSEVDHLKLRGLFRSPTTSDTAYYNTSYDNYNDVSGNGCGDFYFGLAIDMRLPIDGVTISGSTGCKIHDMYISTYTHLIAIAINGVTRNAEAMRFENIQLGSGKTGIITGQAQEKDNEFKGIYAWDRLHTVVSIGHHGAYQAGEYHFIGGNIAGKVIRLFDISAAGWYSTSIDNWFCESIATIGNFSTQVPIPITNCTFHFVFKSVIGRQILLTSNSLLVNFTGCKFRYYGNADDMWGSGRATFTWPYKFSGKWIWKS